MRTYAATELSGAGRASRSSWILTFSSICPLMLRMRWIARPLHSPGCSSTWAGPPVVYLSSLSAIHVLITD